MHPKIPVSLKLLNKTSTVPAYATDHSSGIDLHASIDQDVILRPFERLLIPSGISVKIPYGYEAQIRSRSGLALKHGLMVLNTPGTIDADYTGEIKVILFNASQEEFTVTPGMRFAQMVFCPVVQAQFEIVDSLGVSQRDENGFGSTGV